MYEKDPFGSEIGLVGQYIQRTMYDVSYYGDDGRDWLHCQEQVTRPAPEVTATFDLCLIIGLNVKPLSPVGTVHTNRTLSCQDRIILIGCSGVGLSEKGEIKVGNEF